MNPQKRIWDNMITLAVLSLETIGSVARKPRDCWDGSEGGAGLPFLMTTLIAKLSSWSPASASISLGFIVHQLACEILRVEEGTKST
jgi:hypothetical protein